MKYFVIFLKVLLIITTGAIALLLNFLGSVSMLVTETNTTGDPNFTGKMIFWMIFTFVLYVVPTFLVMLKKYIVAAGMSVAGAVCSLIFSYGLFDGKVTISLWLLIITILVILIAIFGNWDKMQARADEKEKQKNAPSPSVLADSSTDNVKAVKKKR